MCLNCGCGMMDNDMGDKDNVVLEDLALGAIASNMNGQETLTNMKQSLEQIKVEDLDKKIEEVKKRKSGGGNV